MTRGNLLLQLLCKRTQALETGWPKYFLREMEKTRTLLINLNKFAGFRVIYGHLSLTGNTLLERTGLRARLMTGLFVPPRFRVDRYVEYDVTAIGGDVFSVIKSTLHLWL